MSRSFTNTFVMCGICVVLFTGCGAPSGASQPTSTTPAVRAASVRATTAPSVTAVSSPSRLSAPTATRTPPPTPTSTSARRDAAQQLFATYQALGVNFDPTIVDLYANNAFIQNTRRYPDGTTRTITIPMDQYRTLIRAALPLAQERGDTNTYTNVTYTDEGENVRIEATRYSHLKNYTSPMTLLVGPDADGTWRILKEISESQP